MTAAEQLVSLMYARRSACACLLYVMSSEQLRVACLLCSVLLLQMLIKGIRSFAPENNAAIEFYKPLTLIVGSNGAGKTVRTVSSGFGL